MTPSLPQSPGRALKLSSKTSSVETHCRMAPHVARTPPYQINFGEKNAILMGCQEQFPVTPRLCKGYLYSNGHEFVVN